MGRFARTPSQARLHLEQSEREERKMARQRTITTTLSSPMEGVEDEHSGSDEDTCRHTKGAHAKPHQASPSRERAVDLAALEEQMNDVGALPYCPLRNTEIHMIAEERWRAAVIGQGALESIWLEAEKRRILMESSKDCASPRDPSAAPGGGGRSQSPPRMRVEGARLLFGQSIPCKHTRPPLNDVRPAEDSVPRSDQMLRNYQRARDSFLNTATKSHEKGLRNKLSALGRRLCCCCPSLCTPEPKARTLKGTIAQWEWVVPLSARGKRRGEEREINETKAASQQDGAARGGAGSSNRVAPINTTQPTSRSDGASGAGSGGVPPSAISSPSHRHSITAARDDSRVDGGYHGTAGQEQEEDHAEQEALSSPEAAQVTLESP